MATKYEERRAETMRHAGFGGTPEEYTEEDSFQMRAKEIRSLNALDTIEKLLLQDKTDEAANVARDVIKQRDLPNTSLGHDEQRRYLHIMDFFYDDLVKKGVIKT